MLFVISGKLTENMLVRSTLDRAPAPACTDRDTCPSLARPSLYSSTRNIGIRPHWPELQQWQAAAQARFSPKKCQTSFQCNRHFFNVNDENWKFSKLEVLKIGSSQNLEMKQVFKSVDFNSFERFLTLHNFDKIWRTPIFTS